LRTLDSNAFIGEQKERATSIYEGEFRESFSRNLISEIFVGWKMHSSTVTESFESQVSTFLAILPT
jgi:hypothetical protein